MTAALEQRLRALERTWDVWALGVLARGPVTFDGHRYWFSDLDGRPAAVDPVEGGLVCANHDAMLDRCVAIVWLHKVIQEGLR